MLLIVAASAFITYVLFGYPLLLGFLARRFAKAPARGPYEPSVSIIVAVHNGAQFIEAKLKSILALDYERRRMEIIVASDGSTDRTIELARRFEPQGVRVLDLPRKGKPATLNAAVAASSGEVLVLTDVRQTLAPESLRLLLENLADPQVGAASGELVILDGERTEERQTGLYWRYELWIRLRLSELDSIFGATGAYYAIRRNLFVPIPDDSLLDDMYLPLAAFFRGYRLLVDPRARMFDYPTGLESEFRRKWRTLAGNYQIIASYPGLLLPWRNRLWLHFMSYKFGRLLLPFALLIILAASFSLLTPWRELMIGAQGVFYGTAIADIWIPEGRALKRVTGVIRTFVTLMGAAFLAASVFFVPSSWLWKPQRVSGAGSR